MREHEKQTPAGIQIPLYRFFLSVFLVLTFLILRSSFYTHNWKPEVYMRMCLIHPSHSSWCSSIAHINDIVQVVAHGHKQVEK